MTMFMWNIRTGLLCGLFLWLMGVIPTWASAPFYDIAVAYRETSHRIEGAETITFTNNGPIPLSEVYLFLYPNIYREQPHAPLMLRRAYPVGFNPGGMEVLSVSDWEGALPYATDTERATLLKVLPRNPIPSGGQFVFQVRFITTIPEKFGVFGYYRNLITLQDGWHPYLPALVDGKWAFDHPPLKSRFHVRLQVDDTFRLMASAPFHREADNLFSAEADDLLFFSLSMGKRLVLKEAQVNGVSLVLHARGADRNRADRVMRIAKEAASYFETHAVSLPSVQIQIATAYLYQDMIGLGERLLYVNTSILRVPTFLRRFHEARIARGIFFLLWREAQPKEELWVLEGLADLTTEQFIRRRDQHPSDLSRWLKPVAFIPLVDEVLYSKTLPSRHVYFKETAIPAVNEEVLSFNQTRIGGTTIFSKLKNLLGQRTVAQAVSVYLDRLAQGPVFRDVLSEISGRNLDWFFEQWLVDNPVLDFGIEKIEKRTVEAGHETRVLVHKQGAGVEPLEIRLQERSGAETTLVWEGQEAEHEVVVTTASPIRTVELDPQRESSDPNRSDNQIPRSWKLLLNRFGLSHYNLNTQALGYKAGFLLQPVYDKTRSVRIDFEHAEEGNTAGISYSRVFKNHHTLTTGLFYQGPKTPSDKPPEETVGVLGVGYALSYPDIPLVSDALRRLIDRNPYANLTFGYKQGLTRSNMDRLFSVTLDLRKTISFSNYHGIVLRFLAGESFGQLFQNSRFFLGGDDGMRGFTPLAFEGDNLGLFSVEYRFPLLYETELNLLGLLLTRTLQGALFADAGQVTESRNIFHFSEYQRDLGVGIRWYADLFGVYPLIIRFDMAQPVRPLRDDENGLHYYLSGGQSF